MRKLAKILIFISGLWVTLAFAEFTINTQVFVNGGTLESQDKITIHVSERLDNSNG